MTDGRTFDVVESLLRLENWHSRKIEFLPKLDLVLSGMYCALSTQESVLYWQRKSKYSRFHTFVIEQRIDKEFHKTKESTWKIYALLVVFYKGKEDFNFRFDSSFEYFRYLHFKLLHTYTTTNTANLKSRCFPKIDPVWWVLFHS